jgi:ribosomal protein S18 acetylase RimI-like enzyme
VTYADLGGLEGSALDDLIAQTLDHYRRNPRVESLEWKTRGHDAPADLGERLARQGLAPEERETVMIGAAAALAADVALPPEVSLRRAGDGTALDDDVTRTLSMQTEVFGREGGVSASELMGSLEDPSGGVELWLAVAGGEVVSAGRLDVVTGTGFAGLWGGATLPAWRGRGLYRALTAARARSALARGVRYLYSDCTDMSRPILERSGLIAITTTTPYVWRRPVG